MNSYVTGAAVKALREKLGMTQAQLAEKLSVSDKAVSKWETGKGYPDVSLLEPLAEALGVSLAELLSGNAVENTNVSANMLRTNFYVCPVCGNLLTSVGAASLTCHGITLPPLEAEEGDLNVEVIEDEYYVTKAHSMTKGHYISFMAALTSDSVQIVKLYPEGACSARFKMRGVRAIYYYCNKDGFFKYRLKQKGKEHEIQR